MKYTKEKAVTLIALVITIVVLIIFATVIVNLSLGDNGIFNRARTAKEQYQNAEGQEQTDIAKVTNEIDSYTAYGNRNTALVNLNFSLNEKIVGMWIDEKPIYQRTIDCGALSSSGYKDVNHNIENIDKIVSVEGIGFSTNGWFYPIPFSDSDEGLIYITANNTTIRLWVGGVRSNSNITNTYITLLYTKTTD